MDGGGWSEVERLNAEAGNSRRAAHELAHLLSRRDRLASQVHAAVAVALEPGTRQTVLQQALQHVTEAVLAHAQVNDLIRERLSTLKGNMVSDD